MKKRALPIFLGLAILFVSIIGGTLAWFFSKTEISGSGNAAKIELYECLAEEIKFDNILPGETIDLGGNVIYYVGTREAIVQFKLVGTGFLLPGSENTKDWNNLDPLIRGTDYTWNTSRYQYTDKRMNEVLSLYQKPIKFPGGSYDLFYQSNYDPNVFYVHVTPTSGSEFNFVSRLGLKFTGELGGGYKGTSPVMSPSRQFEQQSFFENAGVRMLAVQVTEEAIADVLGPTAVQDVKDMMDKGIFTEPAEWTYTG